MRKKRRHYSGVQMVCPYFSREEDRAINCWTGDEENMRLRMVFPCIRNKKEWARRYCENFDYWRCPLCAMIDEEEREDGNP